MVPFRQNAVNYIAIELCVKVTHRMQMLLKYETQRILPDMSRHNGIEGDMFPCFRAASARFQTTPRNPLRTVFIDNKGLPKTWCICTIDQRE